MSTEEIKDFTALEADIQTLIKESAITRENSYSPYSKFKVGAGVLCNDGTIFTGCNVENASYPVSTCAERGAISKAVSEGRKKFKAVAVVADTENSTFVSPCGFCRQAIAEFGDVTVYMTSSDMKKVLKTTVDNLLPHAFHLRNAQVL
ncbi:cytidine deaminase-like [Calliopsis andreniformis]|uniref:cytidine deaminase-like n=1 Tax=Calliopsis andreniformis TaxID=337506 RepID=UPI003FCC404F